MNDAIADLEEKLDGIATDFEYEDMDDVEGVLHFRLATDKTAQEYTRPSSAVYILNGRVREFDIRIGDYDGTVVEEALKRTASRVPHNGVDDGGQAGDPTHIRAYNIESDVAAVARFLRKLVRELGAR